MNKLIYQLLATPPFNAVFHVVLLAAYFLVEIAKENNNKGN